jgi:hypothetical protein
MAPVLQCPDCGQKHPVDQVSGVSAFRCEGCGRQLKVPPELSSAPPAEPVQPTAFPPRLHETRAPASALPVLPRTIRILIWFVALPLGFFLVFGFAVTVNLLTTSQLSSTMLDSGWNRFWPIARLLPIWALVTTLIVHFGNVGIARWRESRRQGRGRGNPPSGQRSKLRSRSRTRRPPARVAS